MTANTTLLLVVLASAVFALAYFPLVTSLSKGLVSPYAKADLRKRFTAAAIDGLLCTTFLLFYITSRSAPSLVLGAAYLLLRDALFRGRSVGKLLLGLVVIDLVTGRPCTLARSAQRNFLLLIPGMNAVAVVLEAVTVVRDPQGQRLGDRFAQTQVVEGLDARELVKSLHRMLGYRSEIRGARRPADEPVKVDRGLSVWDSQCSHFSAHADTLHLARVRRLT